MNSKDANELKRGAGYLKEKAIIGITRVTGNELDRAIFKVTSHKLKAPKEKHIQRVLAATRGYNNQKTHKGKPISEYVVTELEKRLHTHNWIVVLKTLVTFHRLMRDGSDEVNTCIQQNRNIFCFRNIKDLSESAEGAVQGIFIRQYMYYLEERSSLQRSLGASKRIEGAEFGIFLRSLDVETLGPVFQSLLSQLTALVEVRYKESMVDNFCTMEAFQMLVNDGKVLYQIVSDRAIFILDGFSAFTLQQKKAWVEQYKVYTTVGERLRLLFNSIIDSKRAFQEPPPRLKALPGSLLESLERDIRLSSIHQEEITETLESLGIAGCKAGSLEAATCSDTALTYSPRCAEGRPDTREVDSHDTTQTKQETVGSIDDLFASVPLTGPTQKVSFEVSAQPPNILTPVSSVHVDVNPNVTYGSPATIVAPYGVVGQCVTDTPMAWKGLAFTPAPTGAQGQTGFPPSLNAPSVPGTGGNFDNNAADPFKDLYANQKNCQ